MKVRINNINLVPPSKIKKKGPVSNNNNICYVTQKYGMEHTVASGM
jgi:hypothetical protein